LLTGRDGLRMLLAEAGLKKGSASFLKKRSKKLF
jgi:hypothetical protein